MEQNENLPSIIPNILATSCITCNAKYQIISHVEVVSGKLKMWKIISFPLVIYSMCL